MRTSSWATCWRCRRYCLGLHDTVGEIHITRARGPEKTLQYQLVTGADAAVAAWLLGETMTTCREPCPDIPRYQTVWVVSLTF